MTGFDAADFFQTVNRKISGFRATPFITVACFEALKLHSTVSAHSRFLLHLSEWLADIQLSIKTTCI